VFLEDRVMVSRKWLSVLTLTAMLLVGWFVGAQSISRGQQPLDNLFGEPGEADASPEEDLFAAPETPAAPGPMPAFPPIRPTAWEYKTEIFHATNANTLGKDGWELVTVYVPRIEPEAKAVYKRPIAFAFPPPAIPPTEAVPAVPPTEADDLFGE
jgi:hypothetical protein